MLKCMKWLTYSEQRYLECSNVGLDEVADCSGQRQLQCSDVGLPPSKQLGEVARVPGCLDEVVDLAGHAESYTILQTLQLLSQAKQHSLR